MYVQIVYHTTFSIPTDVISELFNKLPHFVIKMLARFQCLPKIVLKKVQNKNSIPTAKMPPPQKKGLKKSKKQNTSFLNNVLQYVYLQY